jgi:hypothetical protein
MGSWWVQRQLGKNVTQMRAAREELAIADEQSFALVEGEADVVAMDRHRQVLRERIRRLQQEQDRLLDRMGSGQV